MRHRGMTVREMVLVVALIRVTSQILGDFVFDGSGQHLLSPFSQNLGQGVLGTY